MNLTVLNPSTLSLADERFRISFLDPPERLLFSLRAVGLVDPPIFVERGGMPVLLAGWKRVVACRRLGWQEMTARIFQNPNDLECLRLSLFENLGVRELTLMEKAEATARLLRFGESREMIRSGVLPQMGFARHRETLDLLLAAADMEPEIKNLAARDIEDLSVLRLFVRYGPREQKALLPWLSPAGRNVQREILEDLREAARLEGTSVLALLEGEDIRSIRDSERLSFPQQTDLFRTVLRKKRHPSSSSRREQFERLLSRAGWPRNAPVEPAPFFEDDIFSVGIRFRSATELRKLLREMMQAAESREFSEALRPRCREGDDDLP